MILKLAGLFSFAGGPLFWADALKPVMKNPWPFAVTFVPVGMMIFGMATISDREPPTLLSRAVVWMGLVGGALLGVMNLGALWKIIDGFAHPNQTMILVGMVVGTVATAWYGKQAHGFLKEPNAGVE